MNVVTPSVLLDAVEVLLRHQPTRDVFNGYLRCSCQWVSRSIYDITWTEMEEAWRAHVLQAVEGALP